MSLFDSCWSQNQKPDDSFVECVDKNRTEKRPTGDHVRTSNDCNDQKDDIDFYDSDPGDITYRRMKTPVLDPRENVSFSKHVEGGVSIPTTTANFSEESDYDVNDSREVVEHMLSSTHHLIYHRAQREKRLTAQPVGAQVWIERGYILENTTVDPKLVWVLDCCSSNHHHHHHHDRHRTCFRSYKDDVEREGVVERNNHMLQKTPFSMNLMDIQKILPVGDVDRARYPFAKTDHSFIVKGPFEHESSDHVLFEARSRHERNVLMRNLKLVVARVASQAFTRDANNLVKEFYGGGNNE